jgi:heme A synthase
MKEAPQLTEELLWQKTRKRIRAIALVSIGLFTLCLMSGIGLLTLDAKLPGIILLMLSVVLLLVGMYMNAASRLIRYTDGSTEWEWEKKEREKAKDL